jgi:hypothetical protein
MGKNKKEIKLKVRLNKVRKDKVEKGNNKDEIQNNFEEAKPIDRKEKNIYSSQEEKIEHDKKLMMWAGVSFFMILFIILWLANMKNVFKQVEQGRDNSKQFEWNKITDEFSQTMGQIKESLNELKQATTVDPTASSTAENLNNYLPKNENASTAPALINGAGNDQDISALKDRLKELENSINNN